MGYKHDQNYHSPTVRAEDSTNNELPPPYTEEDEAPTPKTEAQPSPTPETSLISSNLEGRRNLLLVYVHGFMGNETSFQKFPTHVHNLLGERLAHQHAVQSIVYPKYKSRKKIDFARDELVHWCVLLLFLESRCFLADSRLLAGLAVRQLTMQT